MSQSFPGQLASLTLALRTPQCIVIAASIKTHICECVFVLFVSFLAVIYLRNYFS